MPGDCQVNVKVLVCWCLDMLVYGWLYCAVLVAWTSG